MRVTFRAKLIAVAAVAALALSSLFVGAQLIAQRTEKQILGIQRRYLPKITVIEAPPSGTLRLRSGLVDHEVQTLVLLPLLHLGKVAGILELALIGLWTERASELLLSVRETISIALEVARARAATTELLEETRRQRQALEGANRDLDDAGRRLEQKAEELESASAYKSQANMSHELRTPLNAIIGFSELIYDGQVGLDAPQAKEFVGDILASGRHLLQLINDVLDLSKVEAGKIEFHPEHTEMGDVVGEVLAILRSTSAARRVRIEAEVDDQLGSLFLDPARLKQVLYNYVSNAIKFSSEGGTVHVRARADGEQGLLLEVEDRGIGIAAADLGRLWREFQQVHREGAPRRAGGTGLGLALTKRLVEAQGGTVGVRSVVGEGSVFRARLPRRVAALRPVVPPPAPVIRAGAPVVLVIEDNPADQADLMAALSGAGYSVEVAATGAEALARWRERRYDAVTLDLLLPDMTGLEVLRQIRELSAEVPVIVITVVTEPGAVAGCVVHDVLAKPLSPEKLLASLVSAGVSPNRAGSVLVVDDDVGSQRLMAATLRQLGYEPRCEPDGVRALAAFNASPSSAIVLDLSMPQMDGFEFLARLRLSPHGRRVPVIVWTVKDLSPEEHRLLRASAQAVVPKGQGAAVLVMSELLAFLPRGSSPD